MLWGPAGSTLTDTLFPYTTLFRSHQHLGTRRAHCGMQHAEQPALLCEKVEWLHAHEGAAKGPGFQATTREDVCNWRRTPSVTIASFPVQRKRRWQSVSLVPTQGQAGV